MGFSSGQTTGTPSTMLSSVGATADMTGEGGVKNELITTTAEYKKTWIQVRKLDYSKMYQWIQLRARS